MKLNIGLLVLFSVMLFSCEDIKKEKETQKPVIVNFDEKEAFNAFNELNLDATCPNLLDPKNTTEAERNDVISSWSTFHQKVLTFLKEENFDWEVPDSTISVFNRIYFHQNGKINHYVFKINTPSVTDEKKAEFGKVLMKFSENVQLDLKRDADFAQCGKTKYLNY